MSIQRIILQVLGYLLFGLVVYVVFVYLMFPYDLLRQRVVDRFSQGTVQVDIARMQPTLFPPGLSLQQVRVMANRPNMPEEVVTLQTFRAWPKWLSMLSEKKDVRFDGALYDGHISGEFHYAGVNGEPSWQSEAQFEGLDVARYPLLQQLQSNDKLAVQGRLSGEATAKLNARGQLEQGEIAFQLKPAVFAPGEAARLPLRKEIPCHTLKGEVMMTLRQWQIDDLTCQGDDVFIDLRGTVRPRRPVENSVLNIRMELRSDQAFKPELDLIRTLVRQRPSQDGALKFGLRGPLSRPRAVR
ncbi:MAG: type II secretion system protein GspN [Candidatus Tectomicrobia bacterium]|nr:type II secretion system protein GspN [Candidatus Tectomicrobia bacterium]